MNTIKEQELFLSNSELEKDPPELFDFNFWDDHSQELFESKYNEQRFQKSTLGNGKLFPKRRGDAGKS